MRIPIRLKLILAAIVSLLVSAMAFVSVASASEAKPFGIEKFTMQTTTGEIVEEVAPSDLRLASVPYSFTQAGGHPSALTTTVEFANEPLGLIGAGEPVPEPSRDAKDVIVDLPPGLLGDPNPELFPRCPLALLLAQVERCPTDMQIGVVRLRWFGGQNELAPLVNLTPEKGQSAEFGIENDAKKPVVLTAHVVRVGSTYGLTVVSNNIPTKIELDEVETTFWGVPAAASHDPLRGVLCFAGGGTASEAESGAFKECQNESGSTGS